MNFKRKIWQGTLLLAILSLAWIVTVFVTEPWVDGIWAQQGAITPVPRAGTLYSANLTTTTILTVTPVPLLAPGSSGTDGTGKIVGNYSIFGYYWMGAATPCFVQVFDRGPTATQVTVGTTVPLTSLPVEGSSSLGIQTVSTWYPMLTGTSTLQVAATTTPTGSTACGTSPVGFMVYK